MPKIAIILQPIFSLFCFLICFPCNKTVTKSLGIESAMIPTVECDLNNSGDHISQPNQVNLPAQTDTHNIGAPSDAMNITVDGAHTEEHSQSNIRGEDQMNKVLKCDSQNKVDLKLIALSKSHRKTSNGPHTPLETVSEEVNTATVLVLHSSLANLWTHPKRKVFFYEPIKETRASA